MEALTDNFLALLVAIVDNCPPERAFVLLEEGKTIKNDYRSDITDDDIQDMIILKKQGLTYLELGEIYGMKKDAVYARLRRFFGGSVKNINFKEAVI